MAQIDTANTFVTGDVIDAPSLNNIIDQAFAQAAIITGQTPLSGTIDSAADKILIYDASATGLRQALISALPGAGTVTNVSAVLDNSPAIFNFTVGTPASTPAIHLSLDNQGPNKVLAGPASGSATTPTFRLLSPADLPVSTVDIAAHVIDWSLGNCFNKSLTATESFTFSNPTEGQTIMVHLSQDATGGRTVGWPTGASGVFWPGGVKHTMSSGAGRHDILTFRYIRGHYYGSFLQDFQAV